MAKYKLVFVALVAVASCSTIAFAQENRGTAEQRAACTPDALRLCASSIFDASKVESCLRMKKGELTAPCRWVLIAASRQQKQIRDRAGAEAVATRRGCADSEAAIDMIDHWMEGIPDTPHHAFRSLSSGLPGRGSSFLLYPRAI
jgi:hypothetical protein